MNCLTDIILYEHRFSHSTVIQGFHNIMNIPDRHDIIKINGIDYEVIKRKFDFDKNVIHILLEPVVVIKCN